jgi:trafficking protein particle complex subunit 8
MNLTSILQIPVSLKSKVPTQLSITHAKYDFLGLLSVTESLASRGRKLHDTPLQRQQPTYAPDAIMQVEVVASYHKLIASYIEDGQLVLMQGENKSMRLLLTNAGSRPISEVWMVAGVEDEIWVGATDNDIMQNCAYLNWEVCFFGG